MEFSCWPYSGDETGLIPTLKKDFIPTVDWNLWRSPGLMTGVGGGEMGNSKGSRHATTKGPKMQTFQRGRRGEIARPRVSSSRVQDNAWFSISRRGRLANHPCTTFVRRLLPVIYNPESRNQAKHLSASGCFGVVAGLIFLFFPMHVA